MRGRKTAIVRSITIEGCKTSEANLTNSSVGIVTHQSWQIEWRNNRPSQFQGSLISRSLLAHSIMTPQKDNLNYSDFQEL